MIVRRLRQIWNMIQSFQNLTVRARSSLIGQFSPVLRNLVSQFLVL